MAKIHVLTSDTSGNFNVVLHTAVLAGNNSAGKSWKNCMLVAGRAGTTIMSEGTGPGQITTAEKAQVVAGDVWEIPATITVDVNLSGQALLNLANELCDAIIDDYKSRMQRELKYYGFEVAS